MLDGGNLRQVNFGKLGHTIFVDAFVCLCQIKN